MESSILLKKTYFHQGTKVQPLMFWILGKVMSRENGPLIPILWEKRKRKVGASDPNPKKDVSGISHVNDPKETICYYC